MICISIAGLSFERCREALSDAQMAEIRLDRLDFSLQQVREVFSMRSGLIAACRPGNISEAERTGLLLAAVEAGAAYADIEIDAGAGFRETVTTACRKNDCKVIISYHNYENTPPLEELKVLVNRCFSAGADVAKIACQVNCEADAARILSLYDRDEIGNENKKIVAIGMGEKGKITRPAALLLGAPFTYAALSEGRETAPGQMSKQTLEEILDRLTG
ncbi:MAG: type I 3-dehydroquinate dehydratase [Candidatus Aminicenantes bacterium]|nr:type I 3-dehydroquinate dehydratase [Candidatus Aminicenantes bacterium]